jgi:hypothetical protein
MRLESSQDFQSHAGAYIPTSTTSHFRSVNGTVALKQQLCGDGGGDYDIMAQVLISIQKLPDLAFFHNDKLLAFK